MDEALRAAVLRRLALLDEAAERGEADSLVPLARAEIHRLADGWRLLLTVHQQGPDGRCRACPGVLRNKRWPCQVWTMAHQHLIGEGSTHRERRRARRSAHRAAHRAEEVPGTAPGGPAGGVVGGLPGDLFGGLPGGPPGNPSGDPEATAELPVVVSKPRHALPE
ncbi:hypothetical protein GCM10009634_62690 [Saccharothrix xinjiangensis]